MSSKLERRVAEDGDVLLFAEVFSGQLKHQQAVSQARVGKQKIQQHIFHA